MYRFYVNGSEWALCDVTDTYPYLTRSDGSITIGMTDNNTKTVYIYAHLKPERYKQVLCHELVHVICFEYGISVPIETEELIADFVGTYFWEIGKIIDGIEKLCVVKN